MKYEELVIEVLTFAEEDVITASGEDGGSDTPGTVDVRFD